MTDEFFSQRLQTQGINVLVPNTVGKTEIDRIICTELIRGITSPSSATRFAQVVQGTIEQEQHPVQIDDYGVLLACTELGLLLPHLPSKIRFLDTANLHATSAWKIATEQIAVPWD